MAETRQVQCIRKRDRQNPHERIEGIGGVTAGGSRWYLTEDDAIAAIESDRIQFWTTANGKSVWVIIAVHLGRKYLKTQADGLEPNNLLALPPCPLLPS